MGHISDARFFRHLLSISYTENSYCAPPLICLGVEPPTKFSERKGFRGSDKNF